MSYKIVLIHNKTVNLNTNDRTVFNNSERQNLQTCDMEMATGELEMPRTPRNTTLATKHEQRLDNWVLGYGHRKGRIK